MELLGANLDQLLHKVSGKFSLKTVIQLADQMIERIKFVHDNDYLHRDIKPENFLMGRRDKTDKVSIRSEKYIQAFRLKNLQGAGACINLSKHYKPKHIIQGRSQGFPKGGHTVSNNIVMAFSPRNIAGCLLKKRLTKGGGGVTEPQDPPSYALVMSHITICSMHTLVFKVNARNFPSFYNFYQLRDLGE